MRISITEEWLREQYCNQLASVEQIAAELKCSVPSIKKYLKQWRLLRGKVLQKNGLVPAWNKGLTKETDERVKAISDSHIGDLNPMSGKAAWNAGLTAETDSRMAMIAAGRTGVEFSEATREKMRQAKLGKVREKANNWKGGLTYLDGYGVHRRTIDGRRMYAHRLVAEQCLERRLMTFEEVHHIDCNRGNNDKTNLLVLLGPEHNLLHRAIEEGNASKGQQIAWLQANSIPYEALE